MDTRVSCKITGCLKVLSLCLLLCISQSKSNYCDLIKPSYVTRRINCSAPSKTISPNPTIAYNPTCVIHNQKLTDIPKSCRLNITYIYMFSCCLDYLDEDILRRYDLIECIDLPYNSITVLLEDVFLNNKRLKKIHITNNNISKIEPGAFNGLANLKTLDLSHNNLNAFVPSPYGEYDSLETLRLDGNRFNSSAVSLTFQNSSHDFPNLKDLSLSANEITDWSAGKMENLEILNLANNRIQTWKTGNKIPNIKILDLSNNQISVLQDGSFDHNQMLISIDLSNNQIQSLDRKMFQNLCRLLMLNLSGNLLTSVHPEWFAVVAHNMKNRIGRNGNEIGIENNPWKCDCSLLYLKELLENPTGSKRQKMINRNNWPANISCNNRYRMIKLENLDIKNCPNRSDFYITGVCRIELSSTPSSLPVISSPYIYFPLFFAALVIILLTALCLVLRKYKKPNKEATRFQENNIHLVEKAEVTNLYGYMNVRRK